MKKEKGENGKTGEKSVKSAKNMNGLTGGERVWRGGKAELEEGRERANESER